MPTRNDPLLFWCSSHHTLAAEEPPLLLEAGVSIALANFSHAEELFITLGMGMVNKSTSKPAWLIGSIHC